MGKPSKRRSAYPYYRVQKFETKSMAWMDARKEGFDELEEARIYIQTSVTPSKGRIIIVEAHGRRVLECIE